MASTGAAPPAPTLPPAGAVRSPRDLAAALLRVDLRRADRPALVDGEGERTLTYAALAARVASAAAALDRPTQGLALVLVAPQADVVAAYLGALASGHAVALVDPATPPAQVGALARRYAAEVVVGPPERVDAVPLPGGRRVDLAGAAAWVAPGEGLPVHDELALLLTTSGSTGSPKLVRLAARNVVANAEAVADALDVTADDRAVASLPLAYSYGLSVLHSHLVRGATVVLTDRSVIERGFWELVGAAGCTSFAGVPSTYAMLERIGVAQLAPPRLTTLTQAGGRLDTDAVLRYDALMKGRGGRFVVMYGQTEATARMACLPPALLPDHADRVGPAIPGGSFAVEVDGALTTAPGVVGEVVYRGPNVMMGYATGRADLARGDDLGGVLATGDLGELDAHGCLRITGRLKRIAKVGGVRIALDEVEALAGPGGRVAVTGADDQIVVHHVLPVDDPGGLRRRLARTLRVHHTAVVVHPVAALPLTPSGKVDYAALAAAVAPAATPERSAVR